MRKSRCLPCDVTSSTGRPAKLDGGEARHAEVGAGQRLAGERRAQSRGGEEDGVAFRHGRACPTAWGGILPARARVRRACRAPPRRRHAAPRAGRARPSRAAAASASAARLHHALVVAVREQRPAAALDVEHEAAVDQHDRRAGLAPGPMPGVDGAALGPGQRRAVRVGRIGRREHVHARRRRVRARAADRRRRDARTARRRAPRRSSRAGTGRPPRTPSAPDTRPRILPGRAPRRRRRA